MYVCIYVYKYAFHGTSAHVSPEPHAPTSPQLLTLNLKTQNLKLKSWILSPQLQTANSKSSPPNAVQQLMIQAEGEMSFHTLDLETKPPKGGVSS